MTLNTSTTKYRRRSFFLAGVFWAGNITIPVNAQSNSTLEISEGSTLAQVQSSSQSQTAFGGLAVVFSGHQRKLNSTRFSPDGQYILTSSDDRTVRLWDNAGNQLLRLEHQEEQVGSDYFTITDAVFSPDGQLILTSTSSPPGGFLWDRQGKFISAVQGSNPQFSADGSAILSQGNESVYVTDKNGILKAKLDSNSKISTLSPNGNRIITTSTGVVDGLWTDTANLWDQKGNQIANLLPEGVRLESAEFSNDGKRILTTSFRSQTASLWSKDGNLIKNIENYIDDEYGHTELDSAKFSPDGSLIVTASLRAGVVRLWNKQGEYVTALPKHEKNINSLNFSPNSQYIVTASSDSIVRLWDRAGKLIKALKGHQDVVQSAIFSSDGTYIITRSYDKTTRFWDKRGELVAVFPHDGSFRFLRENSIENQVLSWNGDTARLWNLSTTIAFQAQRSESLQSFDSEVAEQSSQSLRLEQPDGAVEKAILSPNGRHILSMALNGNQPRLWSKRGELIATLGGHQRSVQNIGFSPNGKQVFTASMDSIRLWDIKGNFIRSFETGTNANGDVDFSLNGSYLMAPASPYFSVTNLRLWDIQGNILADINGHSPDFSPDGQSVVTVSGKSISLWNLKGKPITQVTHKSRVYSPKFSPDGNSVFTSELGEAAHLWNRQGKQVATVKGHGGEVIRAKFSPDGKNILIFSYDSRSEPAGGVFNPIVDVWNIGNKDSKLLRLGRFTDAEFSPDSRTILVSTLGKSAQLRELNGDLITDFSHQRRVERARFSPQGKYIITTSHDNTAKLWQRDGKLLATLQGHEDAVTDAQFTSDGQKVVTISRDQTVREWDVPSAISSQAQQMDAFQQAQASTIADRNAKAEQLVKKALQLSQQSGIDSRRLALQKLAEALALYQADKNAPGAATVRLYIGNTHASLGELQEAMDSYNKGLAQSQSAGAVAETAKILNGLGQFYRNLADLKTAREFYNKALPLMYQLNDQSGASEALNSIGELEITFENPQEALDLYNQALILSQTAVNRQAEIDSLMGLGSAYSLVKDWENALKGYTQALNISRNLGNRRKEATILKKMGQAYAAQGNPELARTFYKKGLAVSEKIHYRIESADIFYQLARLDQQQNDLVSAQKNVGNSINLVEQIRSNIQDDQLKISYFAGIQTYYRFKIDLLMELHQRHPTRNYDAKALEASDQSRARVLRDLLVESRASITSKLSPQLERRENDLLQKLDTFEKQLIEFSSKPGGSLEIEQLKVEIQKVLKQQQSLNTEIRQATPAYASLQYPEAISLSEIQQELDSDTLLLQYHLGAEKSYLWVIGQASLNSYILPELSTLEAAVQTFRKALQDDSSLSRAGITVVQNRPSGPSLNVTAVNLSEQLLAPAAHLFENKRLVIVPDGELHSIPFAALATPNTPEYRPLLENHPISYLPSASTIAILRRSPQPLAPKTLAILADPVFSKDDARFQASVAQANELDVLEKMARDRTARSFSLNRLPGTRLEADSLLRLTKTGSSTKALGFDANNNWFTEAPLNQFRYVHLATHGIVDSDRPELSSIIVSAFDASGQPRKAFIRLPELFNLDLAAQMVTLSACQTGLGSNQPGEGLVGMTRGLMYAGAERVTVSLWNVPDLETAQLMEQFYKNLWVNKNGHVEGLRAAQLQMWNAGKHPYYWAAFGLQGEWQN